jgi:hypothetical protein
MRLRVHFARGAAALRLALIPALMAAVLAGCTTYRDHLNRGQRMFDENEYERALSIWRTIEGDVDSLSISDQARYAYLRGMTDYRLGFRPDARHWLAIGKAIDMEHPGGLTTDWKTRTEEALDDLNREVYGGPEPAPSASSSAAPALSAEPAPSVAPAPSGSGAPTPGAP